VLNKFFDKQITAKKTLRLLLSLHNYLDLNKNVFFPTTTTTTTKTTTTTVSLQNINFIINTYSRQYKQCLNSGYLWCGQSVYIYELSMPHNASPHCSSAATPHNPQNSNIYKITQLQRHLLACNKFANRALRAARPRLQISKRCHVARRTSKRNSVTFRMKLRALQLCSCTQLATVQQHFAPIYHT
jgi:hypothetical protein